MCSCGSLSISTMSLALVDDSLTGTRLRFPRPEVLLEMKKLANRPKDQHDIYFLEAHVRR